ncbi:MAG: tyrosine-type recombinase/integrase, partial [Pseudanabaena sp.]
MTLQSDLSEQLLRACDLGTLAGQRDYAILRLLIENALKRQQVTAININDVDYERRSLRVDKCYKRQGQLNQKEIISLSLDTANALQDWLNLTHLPSENEDILAPLFISLDRANYGHRLTGTAIYGIVKRAATNVGITEAITPEQLRLKQEKHILNRELEILDKTIIATNETQLRLTNVSNLESENQNGTYEDTNESQISAVNSSNPNALTAFNVDILNALLADKRSLNTRRAYENDLRYFFLAAYEKKPNETVIAQFLQLNRFEAIAIALRYKSDLIK